MFSPKSPIPKLHLLLMQDQHVAAFQTATKTHDLPRSITYKIHNCRLRALDPSETFTAIVSPANSFARLDGAFDDALSRTFAPKDDYHALTRVAQRTVYKQWRGFAPPGTCTLVDLADGDGALKTGPEVWGCRYLMLCPTMRIPQDVRWDREVVYECIWSLLNAMHNHNESVAAGGGSGGKQRIDAVCMTPLATGCGLVDAETWAEQTVLALKHFVEALGDRNGGRWTRMEWGDALKVAEEVQGTYA